MVLRTGDSGEVIVQVAQARQCDLIVLTRERRSWFERMLSVSTTERLVREAPCPVLVMGRGKSASNGEERRFLPRRVS